MAQDYAADELETPWVEASYTAASGVLFMLSGAGTAAEALYDGLTGAVLACTILIAAGLALVILGLDLLVNPFRHRALGILIIVVSTLAFLVLVFSLYLAPGVPVLFVLPVGGIVCGIGAILYQLPNEDKRVARPRRHRRV